MLDVGRSALYVAPKARFHRQPGATPQDLSNQKGSALKARFTPAPVQYIIDSMPQSLSKVILHIVFSTRNREPWLAAKRAGAHAWLSRHHLPRSWGRDCARQRCG